jgi:hypothetical protein
MSNSQAPWCCWPAHSIPTPTAGAWREVERRARRSARRRVRGSCVAATDEESRPRHPTKPESRADAGAKLKIIRGIARSSYGVGPAA